MCVTDLTNPLLSSSPPSIKLLNTTFDNFISIERLQFLHGALGYPIIYTLRRAVETGYFLLFPGFYSKNIAKLLTSDITTFGHVDHKRKNAQSTQAKEQYSEEED